MKFRKLGATNMQVSELGLGCMSLPPDLQEARKMIDTAIDAGINFFDTADLYNHGQNEMMIGDILRKKRQDVFISTKVGNVWDEHEDSWHWDASQAHIKEGVKQSLSRLGTDYIDLYQLHGGTLEDRFEDVVEAFESLKREGVIRHYGISSIRPNVIKEIFQAGRPNAVMMQYSALDRRPEEWLDFIQQNGASVITRGSIAKGLLSSNWQNKISDKGFLDYSSQELQLAISSLEKTTEHLLNGAISFNLQHEAIASLIVGASKQQQLYETIDAYHHPVEQDVLDAWLQITKKQQYTAHRD